MEATAGLSSGFVARSREVGSGRDGQRMPYRDRASSGQLNLEFSATAVGAIRRLQTGGKNERN